MEPHLHMTSDPSQSSSAGQGCTPEWMPKWGGNRGGAEGGGGERGGGGEGGRKGWLRGHCIVLLAVTLSGSTLR